MSKTVHENLIDLQYKLNHAKENNQIDKQEIEALAEKINHQLELDKLAHQPDVSVVEELGLAVSEFEADHPRLSATLRNILQTLQNIGI